MKQQEQQEQQEQKAQKMPVRITIEREDGETDVLETSAFCLSAITEKDGEDLNVCNVARYSRRNVAELVALYAALKELENNIESANLSVKHLYEVKILKREREERGGAE